ncbi:Kinesin-like protein FLA10 [Apostasia shenzhenica]|uniref:Kinesin-like protein FLA10 n=1 Tax=Apostasia shenzhenica TaxID=1088818 RepID=A0A2I0AAT7_9ASPA|nr:Kinesin-like protein FLA10 [Apostasia shenzhenica]
MDIPEDTKSSPKECIKVAVNIRPLVSSELLMGCVDCVTVIPGEPQVQIGAHCFTYDHIYGSSGPSSSCIFDECVAPLVDAIFHGYNATVLAYGQTGSGKTYTMGTNYMGEGSSEGIIPKVLERIFLKVDEMKERSEFLIRVSFIEIFKEEVFDLLDPNATLRIDGNSSFAKPSRAPIQIRETANGGISLAGVTEAVVRSKEEMALHLTRGSQSRATGSTNMNSQSSRSHAIFTICLEQKKIASFSGDGSISNDLGDDILFAKLHLVDLAGSERAKRTGADGLRFKEGIHINKGLLALGNVISALGDDKKRKEGGHVPYRDSKLTRLLQDSLGGNSKTVVIACISPADTNAEETINTLKYANRARNIQNKAVINRDSTTVEMQRLRSQLEQLQTEVLFYRGGGAPLEELQVLRQRISLLETSNSELLQELKERQNRCEQLSKRALVAQVEKDKLILKIEAAQKGKQWDEIGGTEEMQKLDLLRSYASKVQELETELMRMQNSCNTNRSAFMDCLALENDVLSPCLNISGSDCDGGNIDDSGGADEDEAEREHSSVQDKLGKELKELDLRLEQKEAEMKRFSKMDTSVLKQHYEKKLLELEQEKKFLLREIEGLRLNLANISSTSDESAQKLKEEYLHKLTMLESQVSDLKKKQEAQSQLLRQKQKSDEAAKRLQDEIQRIKSQKVQLQQKIKQESEQFRLWKASREKEVLQLKKEGRRNEYEMHKLLALSQRQKMVLQRKTEEAAMATKRLKELLEAKKASSREALGSGLVTGHGIQALMQAIEDELEVTVRVHEVRLEHERQVKERAAMAKEHARLKEEAELAKQNILSDHPQTMSPSARNSRIAALENMLATSSCTVVSMASQLSEAEERERVFSGRGRWNQVRTLAEAKNLMNYLFNLASSSRCQLRDKEAICKEQGSLLIELKEKIYKLNSLIRQLQAQNVAQNEQKKEEVNFNQNLKEGTWHSGLDFSIPGEACNLRKAPQSSLNFNQVKETGEIEADMDTSDSDDTSYVASENETDDDFWSEPRKVIKKKPKGSKLDNNDKSNGEITEGSICCSCSKYSTCKTKKCECRAVGSLCGDACGCSSLKCANRGGSCLDDEKTMELVSEGTMLLQGALNEKLKLDNNDLEQRKPLSDIGNALTNSKAAKPSKRKIWSKSMIQLIPTEPVARPPSVPPQQTEPPPVVTDDLPLRPPRAMDAVPLESHPPFSERNSIRSDESVNKNKENRGSIAPPRSPARLKNASEEKENKML